MFSLRPKEGGTLPPPASPAKDLLWRLGTVLCLILIGVVGLSLYFTRMTLEQRVASLQEQLADHANSLKTARAQARDMASDIDTVRKAANVSAQQLASARKFAERLQADQEKARLDTIFSPGAPSGDRYSAELNRFIDRTQAPS